MEDDLNLAHLTEENVACFLLFYVMNKLFNSYTDFASVRSVKAVFIPFVVGVPRPDEPYYETSCV